MLILFPFLCGPLWVEIKFRVYIEGTDLQIIVVTVQIRLRGFKIDLKHH